MAIEVFLGPTNFFFSESSFSALCNKVARCCNKHHLKHVCDERINMGWKKGENLYFPYNTIK